MSISPFYGGCGGGVGLHNIAPALRHCRRACDDGVVYEVNTDR